ncbi:hypothetical protein CASFOL_032227 [Castilleja foliolosa]|uniref:Uncharacterized protein n=1 Tax=Castilleja foliolosa TaxID=1961234 RepID=A0ABD3C2L7_9LAMI
MNREHTTTTLPLPRSKFVWYVYHTSQVNHINAYYINNRCVDSNLNTKIGNSIIEKVMYEGFLENKCCKNLLYQKG